MSEPMQQGARPRSRESTNDPPGAGDPGTDLETFVHIAGIWARYRATPAANPGIDAVLADLMRTLCHQIAHGEDRRAVDRAIVQVCRRVGRTAADAVRVACDDVDRD